MSGYVGLARFIAACGGEVKVSSPPQLNGRSALQIRFGGAEPPLHLGVILDEGDDLERMAEELSEPAMAVVAFITRDQDPDSRRVYICELCGTAVSLTGQGAAFVGTVCPRCHCIQTRERVAAMRGALVASASDAVGDRKYGLRRLAETACIANEELIAVEQELHSDSAEDLDDNDEPTLVG